MYFRTRGFHVTLAAGRMLSVVVGLCLGGLSGSARAWGVEGHQVVALIAQSQLTPAARSGVAKLLAQEPGATLASVANWADEHRTPATLPLHFVNFPRGNCVYDAARDCPGGRCVVAAITHQRDVLASHAPDPERLTALKYLVHFVGDVHQPLHAGFGYDKGGNTVQLQVFLKGSNLHAFWDTGLIDNLQEKPDAMAHRLLALLPDLPVSDLDPVDAAQESCGIVSLPAFYPQRLVTPQYIMRFTPVMERRLATAGARLAGMLNSLFK